MSSSQLETLWRQVSRDVFLNGTKRDRQWWLAHFEALLAHEAELPRHELAEAEAPFDRLMLHYSASYRKTRELAHEVGAKLRPEYISHMRAHRAWRPDMTNIPYSPVRSELAWWLKRRQKKDALLADFEKLRMAMRPLYHELNHVILFSLLRPTNLEAPTEDEVKHYYTLVECLVRIRDLAHAEELGEWRTPLNIGNAVNYPLGEITGAFLEPLSFERFRDLIGYCFFQKMGTSPRAIAAAWKKTGRPLPGAKTRREYFKVGPGEHENWYDWYIERYGYSYKLPPAATKFRALTYEPVSPERFISEREPAYALYKWFTELFSGSRRQPRS